LIGEGDAVAFWLVFDSPAEALNDYATWRRLSLHPNGGEPDADVLVYRRFLDETRLEAALVEMFDRLRRTARPSIN
jgi:hypothetical protein